MSSLSLLAIAAEIRAIHVERDEARAMVDHVRASRLRVEQERDQVRAELEGVTAQRDELAARVTELEMQLAAGIKAAVDMEIARLRQNDLELRAALASEVRKTDVARDERDELRVKLTAMPPVEIDGFRVGDLVRDLKSRDCTKWGAVARLSRCVEVQYPTRRHVIAYDTDELARKPVKVGDMVRTTSIGPGPFRVLILDAENCAHLIDSERVGRFTSTKNLIAIDPTLLR